MKKNDYKWIALFCTSLGALFSVLSATTLMIALPEIMKDLNTTMTVVTWILMGYMLSLTILVPSIGRVADMIGRKKLFVSGFGIFTVTSVLCALSNSGMQLLIYRLIQSIGGALMVANSTAIVTDAFPKKELGKALGINGMIISVASVIGPILGGFLLRYGWRSTFIINIPIGIIGTVWSALQLKEMDKLPERQKFDWFGTITFTVGMLLFLAALSLVGFVPWNNVYVLSLFFASVIIIALFVYIESSIKYPLIDLKLLKTRVLTFAYASNFFNSVARGALTLLLIFYLQGVKAIDPILAGILLTPFALSMVVVSPISGWLSDKYGTRVLSSAGLLISAFGLIGFMRISESTSMFMLTIWMLIMGFGSGLFFSPNTSAIMSNVPSDKRGVASGLRTMTINAGNVISIALSMAIISSSISPEAMQGLFLGTQVGSQGIAISHFISGLRLAFTISFIISILAAVLSYLRGPEPKWNQESEIAV